MSTLRALRDKYLKTNNFYSTAEYTLCCITIMRQELKLLNDFH